MTATDGLAGAYLRAIADLLGITPDHFFDQSRRLDPAETNELLHLWSGLQTDAGRKSALDALRRIRDEEGH